MPTDGLIDEADLREIFDISVDIKQGRILRHLVAAGREMRTWVGDDAYEDALLEAPTDATRKEDLELAEAHLAMSYAILGINTALRARGIVQTETVEGKTVVRYHSPKEIVELQQAFLDTARSLADAYLLAETTDEAFGLIAGSSPSDCEGVTRVCP